MRTQIRVPSGGTRTDYSSKWDEFLLSKKNPRYKVCIAGSVGSDGGCPLTGYVIWGKQKEYRSFVETVFSYKKAA